MKADCPPLCGGIWPLWMCPRTSWSRSEYWWKRCMKKRKNVEKEDERGEKLRSCFSRDRFGVPSIACITHDFHCLFSLFNMQSSFSSCNAREYVSKLWYLFHNPIIDGTQFLASEKGIFLFVFHWIILDFLDKTALHVACGKGHLQCVQELIDYGSDVYSVDVWTIESDWGEKWWNLTFSYQIQVLSHSLDLNPILFIIISFFTFLRGLHFKFERLEKCSN
jgi:hypothetical protein